ncbi:MAG: 50S ribosomal protein L1 [Lentisphaerae bacterium]|jgi:large subunit ribosomal protein L1|nr:50S ribosomal protein L1 [Lentisphaerota bacterium]
MAKHGKNYRSIKAKAPAEAISIAKAVDFIKEHAGAKFDETVEVAMRLGVDYKKSDQAVRGTVSLPHGTGKSVRVIVFAEGTQADTALAAGAVEAGFEDLLEKVKGGWTDFDVAISTTDAMREVRKLGRVLGPRGLMPNPKTGTVTDDVAPAVTAAMGGRVEFRMDRTGNVCVVAGKRSFEAAKLIENINAVLDAIRAERPASARGTYIRTCTISSTMGVGLRVDIKE